MQLDTDQKGLEAVFKPWQVPLVDELFERDLKSVEAHKFLKEKDARVHPGARNTVSRASVIYFLNDLVDLELLTYTEVRGKGGWGRRYGTTLTREEFALKIIDLFLSKILEAFPEASTTFSWARP